MEKREPSPRPPAQHSGNPFIAIKTGYLMKEGAVVQSWKRRYFVLTGDFISYAALPDGPVIRTIPLKDVLGVAAESYKSATNGISLKTLERVFHLGAEDNEARQAWLRALNVALDSLR